MKKGNRAHTITIAELPKLKRAYNKAVKNGETIFTVQLKKGIGEFYTPYAKYLIEYLTLNSSSYDNRNKTKTTKHVQSKTQKGRTN